MGGGHTAVNFQVQLPQLWSHDWEGVILQISFIVSSVQSEKFECFWSHDLPCHGHIVKVRSELTLWGLIMDIYVTDIGQHWMM